MKGIVADIDNPILGTFAILDEQRSTFKINVAQGKMSYFFHPQSASEHEREHGLIPAPFQIFE
jgi:hypothetical protein